MKIITDDRCTSYHAPGHPERPDRILATLEALHTQNELKIEWRKPHPAGDESILRAHSRECVARLRVPKDFDADTAYHPGIEDLARSSAGAAIDAMKAAHAGETVFSLMRPPGHHATRTQVMGFCYLSNIAIAALEALTHGIHRVAIFDFDVHHGNGTEDILLNQPGAAFFSVHEFPCYPGTGAANVGDNCFNYPVAPNTPREGYRKVLERALADLKAFRPDLIGVSAGFDAYVGDPLANGPLEAGDFHWLGSELSGVGAPMFSVLEGGYSDDLPELILAYLRGVSGK